MDALRRSASALRPSVTCASAEDLDLADDLEGEEQGLDQDDAA